MTIDSKVNAQLYRSTN